MSPRLSPTEVADFHDQGYLLVHSGVFSPARFQALRDHFEELLADWTARGQRAEHMDMPHMTDIALFEWLLCDEILDVVEPLIGPDIALWSSHFICKPAGDGRRVGWHEDSAYWKRALDPMDVVTVWLAIDRADQGNGCMRVIPGSHRHGYSDYADLASGDKAVFGTEIKPGQFDATTAVDCILEPNDCSLHHAKLIHGSEANTSPRRRCGYTMRYVSTASRLDPAQVGPGHRLYLARGQDRAGNVYGDPARPSREWRGPSFLRATV